MIDPYSVLGLKQDASMDEIKKAYRTLSRKYHPDANINNPNKAAAEEKFKQVQQAYKQIMDEKEGRAPKQSYQGQGSYGGAGGYGSGSGQGGYGYDDYGDTSDGYSSFEDLFRHFGGFGGQGNYGGQRVNNESGEDMHLRAAANYINNRSYAEAMNVLNAMSDRSAKWYYLFAIANAGQGNQASALQAAEQACHMEPGNQEYRQLLERLKSGGSWYSDMSEGYGYSRGGSSGMPLCCTCLLVNSLCGPCCFRC